jgi:hypothetical protein
LGQRYKRCMRVDIEGITTTARCSDSGTQHQTAVKFRVIQVFHSPRCPEFTYWASAERRRLLFGNERCSEITAMRSQWGYGSPVGLDCPRSRGRVAGDEREHRRRFDSPAECRVRERGGNGSGLGGRRQSRRSHIPAALLSLSDRVDDHRSAIFIHGIISASRSVRAASRGGQRKQKEICGSDRKPENRI